MTRNLLIVLLAFAPGHLAFGQVTGQLRCLHPKSPEELRQLFHYDGVALPLVSSHRGGAIADYPENCIATFENTLRHTYSLLEIDLQYTKDGHLVLLHDNTLERTTTGTGRVADHTLAELKGLFLKDPDGKPTQHHIPTLDEALEWARGKTILILDKKNVPVDACVAKIEAHHAASFAMVMAYSFQDIQKCHELNRDIMMEVMIGDRARFQEFAKTGIPWNRIIAFVGHTPPEDLGLLKMLHDKGTCCMAGTSRNLDRPLRTAAEGDLDDLKRQYRARLQTGVDLLETDLPIQVGRLLFAESVIPAAKSAYFQTP